MLRNPNNSLSQIHRRIIERETLLREFTITDKHCSNILIDMLKVTFRTTSFTPNNAFMLDDGRIVLVVKIEESFNISYALCQQFKSMCNYFDNPCLSSSIGIFAVQNLINVEKVPLNRLKTKYFLIPNPDLSSFIAFPLIHDEQSIRCGQVSPK